MNAEKAFLFVCNSLRLFVRRGEKQIGVLSGQDVAQRPVLETSSLIRSWYLRWYAGSMAIGGSHRALIRRSHEFSVSTTDQARAGSPDLCSDR